MTKIIFAELIFVLIIIKCTYAFGRAVSENRECWNCTAFIFMKTFDVQRKLVKEIMQYLIKNLRVNITDGILLLI